MSYINEIKKKDTTYNIQDKRIVEVTPEDVGKVLAAKADGTFELVAGGETKLYKHIINASAPVTKTTKFDFENNTFTSTTSTSNAFTLVVISTQGTPYTSITSLFIANGNIISLFIYTGVEMYNDIIFESTKIGASKTYYDTDNKYLSVIEKYYTSFSKNNDSVIEL